MTAVAPPVRVERPLLPVWWPLAVLFIGYPVWWALGVTPVIWPVVAFPLALSLLARPEPIRVPRGFGWWLAFVAWMVASSTQLSEADRIVAFLYRASLYGSATVLFLYIFNMPRERLQTDVVVAFLARFWVIVAVGGLMAAVLPDVGFTSVAERLVPESMRDNLFVHNLVHPSLANRSRILGFPIGRPEAPFPYTNAWGSNFALLTPLLILSWQLRRSARWTATTFVLLVASVVPVVLSLNRGLWLSLAVATAFGTARLASTGHGRLLFRLAVVVAVVAGIVALTPLAGIVSARGERQHSNEGRMALYEQAVDRTVESPLLGYGAPVPLEETEETADDRSRPSVGTHGQFWLVLVAHGIPGAVFFVGWFVMVLAVGRQVRDPVGLWCRMVVLLLLTQLLFYEQLPSQLHIAMAAAALLFREAAAEPSAQPDRMTLRQRVVTSGP